MTGSDTVSGDFLESVAGKDVDITFDMGGDVSWTVNGADISTGVDFAALNLAVGTGTDYIRLRFVPLCADERNRRFGG